ncbi:hypothetical protein NADFUDRAFT_53404 [Nadsonia fulvescens var. elongata DSM 6958]|uniref:Pre-mRNA-splicing factor SYF1 n=1 Tax=Nadsonia fulvescens var. elongata DSM 6958 TaxID=857566 RepID=A0A1E3PED8_9ASCO|nr:hypothetical protein NADFUDRAFT_53404 [Nadsonia fulvescens var. elongata DSM 6958]
MVPSGKELLAAVINDSDIPFELEVIKNPYELRVWMRYIRHKSKRPLLERVVVYERACKTFGRSYKLWKQYLDLRVSCVKGLNVHAFRSEYEAVNDCFQRALVLLNKMPRIWSDYLDFLVLQRASVSYTRQAFNMALQALPLTQHDHIWPQFLAFADQAGGLTQIHVWKRYVSIFPNHCERLIEIAVDNKEYQVAVEMYMSYILNEPTFTSQEGKGPFQLWVDFIELIVKNVKKISNLNIPVEKLIRNGIQKFPDQKGKLWILLANYWINLGDFDNARAIFEEGITQAMTVKDFSQIFNTYAEFEESFIANLMQDEEISIELDLTLERFEKLMDRRPFLLNDLMLRQDPNNVIEWQKRILLWGDNQAQVIKAYTDAIATISPKKVTSGKFYQIWVNYAKLYEEKSNGLTTARVIFNKAINVNYKSVNELAEIYIEWAEMELRNENIDQALTLLKLCTTGPKVSKIDYFDESISPQERIHKSMKLWSFYADIIEGFGTLTETRQVYDRIFELKIATPLTIVNYALFLEENNHFEDSFKIYERGLELFTYPTAFELWNLYLSKAISRKLNVERLRDLFEQALRDCPANLSKPIYLMYGQLEEDRGLIKNAMKIYDQAIHNIAETDRFEVINYYISRCAENFGLQATRQIFESIINNSSLNLKNFEYKQLSSSFAKIEEKLGEIDRVRSIYIFGSQFANPALVSNRDYWNEWNQFEINHGNEDTFKEMLRIKRSVQAQNNTEMGYIAAQTNQIKSISGKSDAMDQLERQLNAPVGFVASSTGPAVSKIQEKEHETEAVTNPNAIDLDDMDMSD